MSSSTTLARRRPPPRTPYALASLGLILSLYAVYVEYKVERSRDDHDGEPRQDEEGVVEIEEFKALCDIEAIGASCRSVKAHNVECRRCRYAKRHLLFLLPGCASVRKSVAL